MDWVTVSKTAIAFLKKYAYVVIILILGLFLMTLPMNQETQVSPGPADSPEKKTDLSEELEEILSQIQGAGEVRVLLTLASGPETVYQQKEDIPAENDKGTIHREPVVITDTSRAQSGLIRMELGPEYLGAIVLCQGADSPAIRLSIVEAVSNATGLSTNRISVLKMK